MAEYQQQAAIRELPDQSRLMSFFNRVNGALAFGGNDITVYTDGYAMLKGLLREISHAQKHIHIQFYILRMIRSAVCCVMHLLTRRGKA